MSHSIDNLFSISFQEQHTSFFQSPTHIQTHKQLPYTHTHIHNHPNIMKITTWIQLIPQSQYQYQYIIHYYMNFANIIHIFTTNVVIKAH